MMTKMIDRILRKGRGQQYYFLVLLLKLAMITAGLYLASLVSERAVLFYILGLSTVVLAIGMEGVYQFYRSVTNART